MLLAKNRAGYENLIRLTSIGFTEGFYRRPRIDKEVLAAHSEGDRVPGGLPLGRGGAASPAGQVRGGAGKSAEWFAQTFGPDGFWLEIQQHGIAEERLVTEGMLRLGQELGLGVVATNDAHYLRREDAEAHDVLLAIGTGSDLDDPKRFRFTGQESYVKSEKEMRALFPDQPEALGQHRSAWPTSASSTSRSGTSCPASPAPPSTRATRRCSTTSRRAGAERRYGAPLPADVARAAGVRARGHQHARATPATSSSCRTSSRRRATAAFRSGPGRGSAAGSLVAYALGITDVDPLKFDLLFERFLNPERVSMPDIDVDFCFERRGEVIEYVRERYGRDSVGQIVTFGTMKARAAVKDVARVLRIPPGEADRITKLIPSGPAYSLTIQRGGAEGGRAARAGEGRTRPTERLVDLSSRIEGISRHMSVHAAGVVIAPGPLAEYVPVCTAPTKGAGAAADGEDVHHHAVRDGRAGEGRHAQDGHARPQDAHRDPRRGAHDRERHGVDARHGRAAVRRSRRSTSCCAQGRTAGVFQFESPLATDTLRAMKCDRFDDLVASNALLRPGPLDAGMHTVFIKRKLGQEKVTYPASRRCGRCWSRPTASSPTRNR